MEELRLEDTAAHLVRNPLSLKKLVYLDGEKAVLYRSRVNPSLGRNFEAMDPSSGSPASVITPLTSASTHAVLRRVLQSGSGLRPAKRGRGRGRAAARAAQALPPELGTADGEGLPGRPSRVRQLRPAHAAHRLRDRPDGHRENPRPPRPQQPRGSKDAAGARRAPRPSTGTAGGCRPNGSKSARRSPGVVGSTAPAARRHPVPNRGQGRPERPRVPPSTP